MYYGGIDALRSYLTVAIVDRAGEPVEEWGWVPIGMGSRCCRPWTAFGRSRSR